MKKELKSLSVFFAAVLASCGVACAAESVMVASEESADVAETQEAVIAQAAEQAGEVQYVEYEQRTKFSGHVSASWWDGFTRNDNSTNLDQVWLTADRAIDTEKYGADWGFHVDAVFGISNGQCYGDETFDGKWGESEDGYCGSLFQAYAELGVEKLSVKLGKFGTPIGYESLNELENQFISYSYMYEHEPLTHCGALVTYAMNDKLSFFGGISAGADDGFENPNGDIGLMFGGSYQITDRLNIGYSGLWQSVHGSERSLLGFDYYDVFMGADLGDSEEFIQTVAVSWDITEKLNYTFVTNYMGLNSQESNNTVYGNVGLGNYFTYTLTDKISLGMRYEWFHQWVTDEADYDSEFGSANYHELSFFANYNISEHFFVRPEVRYDWVDEGAKDDGFSGGMMCGIMF